MIVESLSQALSRPPAKAGRRLRSGHELAELFGVSSPTLRLALAVLEEQGVLAQQQGSGTYLRCLPPANGRHLSKGAKIPTGDQVFAPEEAPKNGAAVDQRTRLKLQLWTHLHLYTPSLQLQLKSFAEAAAASGHDLTVVGATTAEGVYLSPGQIVAKLKHDPCDGYLLNVSVADQVLALFEATEKPFIVFGATPPVRHEPAVLSDDVEAIQRAIPLLAREGYRRIALFSYAGAKLNAHLFAYATAMRESGLDYRCHLTADVVTPDESRRVLLLQLRGAEAPDAIYVSDDNLLPGVALALRDANLTPGRDFGVITMAVKGLPMPAGVAWSQMQFRPRWYAQCVLDNVLGFMQSSDHEPFCQALYHHWAPGDTHRCQARVRAKPPRTQ
jgi:hypothetical protein